MKPLEVVKSGGAPVVVMREDLTQHDYLDLREYFDRQFFEPGEIRLVVDCAQLGQLPSIAFGVFCSLAREAKRRGGKLNLAGVTDAVRRIMTRTHVDRQINVFPSVAEALADLENPD